MSPARSLLAVVAAVLMLSVLLQPTVADERNRAGLVVRNGEGDIAQMCVFFDEDEITGADLLERSRFDAVTEGQAMGTAICSIDGEGCGRDDCFCEYPAFWGYWTRDGGEWRFSDLGAADRTVTDGSVDGWSFGRDGKPAPPDRDIDDICAASASTGTARASTPAAENTAARPSYAAFGGFVALLAVAAAVAYVVRRRPRRP